jgi:hypothetical protein
MKSETTTTSRKIVVAAFVGLLSLAGILVSYRYGLGWFFLFQTIREFLFAIPRLYVLLIQIAAGSQLAEKESLKLEKNRLFTSPALARRAFFSLALTILMFWKANIPLYRVIEMIWH